MITNAMITPQIHYERPRAESRSIRDMNVRNLGRNIDIISSRIKGGHEKGPRRRAGSVGTYGPNLGGGWGERRHPR